MLCSRFCVRTGPGFVSFADHTNTTLSFPHSLAVQCSSLHFPVIPLRLRTKRFRCPNSLLIYCNSSRPASGSGSNFGDHHDHEYLEASLLLSETISHYHMWRHGFPEEQLWKSPISSVPLSLHAKNPRTDINLVREGFLYRFQNPTIFLKISCDGDYILPIVVGKFAIEKLIDADMGHEDEDCPDQFQFVKNLVEKLDHEVIMVRITEKVVSTYFARLYLSKPGKSDNIISVDARPSDAINVANRCKAPIYVSKQIVLTDAIRISYGTGRVRNSRPTYDVLLDSPEDGPDLVSEELSMVKNMQIAIQEERFKDAAEWRDKLADLRKSAQEH